VAAFRTIYRYWAWLVVAAIVVQIGFAGYGAFYVADKVGNAPVNEDKFDDGWGPHVGFGYLVVLLILLLLIIGLIGGVRGRRLWQTGGLFVLGIVQILLAGFGEDVPVIGVLHPINAFVILGLAGSIAWSERSLAAPAPAA
jgi:hypothetical protein